MRSQFSKCLCIVVFLAIVASCGTETKQSRSAMASSSRAGSKLLHLVETILLPNVEGRIDHLAVDIKGQRLFVIALGDNSVQVIDLHSGRTVRSLSGFSEPQGIAFVPELNRIYVANGGNGLVQVLDGSSFVEIGRVQLSGDADNVRYDSMSGSVVVGYGNGGLRFIDAHSGKGVRDIPLAGHPESFQLEPSGSKIFVNIPSVDEIAVVDRTQQKVTSSWLMTSAFANFPMALDENHHRLFVGFRLPTKLGVFDTGTGKMVASMDTVGDTDDIFYDGAHRLVFVIGGWGSIDLYSQQDADHYALVASIPSATGARTGLWVPELNRLFVAMPHQSTQQAGVKVYELQP